MELTLDQALQKGIEAHKAGQIQEADKFYTAILQSQPKHSDANHNLGVLAVGIGKAVEALPFFKTAVEADPSIVQFWISYIDALIKLDRVSEASALLLQAKGKGIEDEEFGQWEQRINELDELYQDSPDLGGSGKSKNRANILDTLTLDQATKLARKKSKSGFSEEAKGLYEDILIRFPKNKKATDGIKDISSECSGAAFKKQDPSSEQIQTVINHYSKGQHQQALDQAVEMLRQFPRSLALHNICGAAYSGLGRFDSALESYSAALEINPDFAEGYSNRGNVLKGMGEFDAAIESYKQALKIKPDYAEPYCNMGTALKDKGEFDAAIESYKQALKIKPEYAAAYYNLGITFAEKGELDAALKSYTHAMKIAPDIFEGYHSLGVIFFEMGEYEKAAEKFKVSDSIKSGDYYLRCLYQLDEQSTFYEQLDYLIGEGEVSATIGSLSSRSEIRYRINRVNPFCSEPMEYVVEKSLLRSYDFKNKFVKTTKEFLASYKIPKKHQSLISNGYQTAGNLFSTSNNSLRYINDIIEVEIGKYRNKFKDSSEGLITKWPSDYTIFGWLISMKSGGVIRPHMHESGWISGSIYINVPQSIGKEDGNLALCIEDPESTTDANFEPPKIIDVDTGSLCLFPSSLLHYTIPFESTEERIVLAFDVTPTRGA